MALDLNEQYSEEGGILNAKIVAALCKKVLNDIIAATPPYDPDLLSFAKLICNAGAKDVRLVARALISQGVTKETLDGPLQTAVDANIDVFKDMINAE